jgi:hypothetical protein
LAASPASRRGSLKGVISAIISPLSYKICDKVLGNTLSLTGQGGRAKLWFEPQREEHS